MKRIILFGFILFSCFVSSFAVNELVIVNSQNWEDVFSGAVFANAKGYDFLYVGLDDKSLEFLKLVDKSSSIILVESSDKKIFTGFEGELKSSGFNVLEVVSGDVYDLNYNLLEFGDFNDVILVDDRLSYNVLSSLSLAKLKRSYVLFFNKNLIKRIEGGEFFSKSFNDVFYIGVLNYEKYSSILGSVGLNVDDSVVSLDKYELNQKIVSMVLSEREISNVILTSGDVLEMEILNGNAPVLFIGKNQVPQSVLDFVSSSGISNSVLIGTSDLQNARLIREKTGIEVLVKISKATVSGTPDPSKALERETLEIFKIEPRESKLDILDVVYNKATKEFVLTVENLGEAEAYFKTGIFLKDLDGKVLKTVGGENVFSLLPSEILSQKIPFNFDSLDSEVMVLSQIFYGESEVSIDKEVKKEMDLEFVTILDESSVEVSEVRYNDDTKRFEIDVKNTGSSEVFVNLKVEDLLIEDEMRDYISDSKKIGVGLVSTFKIKVFLDKVALADNEKINLKYFFGEKEGVLIKEDLKKFDYLVVTESSNLMYFVIIGVLLLILFLVGLVNFSGAKKRRGGKKKQ